MFRTIYSHYTCIVSVNSWYIFPSNIRSYSRIRDIEIAHISVFACRLTTFIVSEHHVVHGNLIDAGQYIYCFKFLSDRDEYMWAYVQVVIPYR